MIMRLLPETPIQHWVDEILGVAGAKSVRTDSVTVGHADDAETPVTVCRKDFADLTGSGGHG
jgi:hypothetical protein